jgi:hypothetical protein
MTGTEGETAIVFLGLSAMGGLSSLAALLWGRKLTATPRPPVPKDSSAAAGTGPAAAEALSPSGGAA